MTKIVFFGTSEFAVPTLEALVANRYEIVAVVTTPDEPVGRQQILTPSPVKIAAEKLGLKVLQPSKLKGNEELLDILLYQLKPEMGVVASYGKIIPADIIAIFKLGLLNIHPSLLPKYRGPSPIQTQLLYGETETGVTIIKLDEQMDHGPIIENKKQKMESKIKYQELHDQLAKLSSELLIEILPDYIAGKIKPKPQDETQVTFTKMITKEDGRIDWKKSANQIFNQFRAFHKWPGIWTMWKEKILKITDCQIKPDGSDIEILSLQLEGGKEMKIKDFIAGHKDFVGAKFE